MLLSFAWILFALATYSVGALCEFEADGYYSYQEILDCYHTIPLDDDIKYTTLETLRRSLEIYSFYDIAHDSPDPNLPMKVNMQQGLDTIANRNYSSDFEFQSDLSYLYVQVRGSHCCFVSSSPPHS